MKKYIVLITLLTLIGLLAACGNVPEQDTVTNEEISINQQEPTSDANPSGTQPEGFQFQVPLQTALIVGSFELEGTENEISAEQAAELLPLWMVLKNLLESDTAANEEIDALTNQIGEAMTDPQMAFINTLELDPQSLRTLMDELGLTEGIERPDSADGEGNGGFQRPEGMPEGMGPGGGQGAGGAGLSPEQMESFQATREASGGAFGGRMGMGNTGLIDALIELLQSK